MTDEHKPKLSVPPMIVTEDTIMVVDPKGKAHSIHKSNVNYAEVLRLVRTQRWEDLFEVLTPAVALKRYVKGQLEFDGGRFLYQNEPIDNVLTKRIFDMMQQGFPIEPMMNFLANLMNNPSRTSVEELFGFMRNNELPITEDGHFLAYKKIREDYKDVHSGTINNSVGSIVVMPRNRVDDNRSRTCSSGLHFCSKGYLASFGGQRIVVLKINPADVVSIPADYNDSKGRCCRYEVVSELDMATAFEGQHTELSSRAVSGMDPDFQDEDEEGAFNWDSDEDDYNDDVLDPFRDL